MSSAESSENKKPFISPTPRCEARERYQGDEQMIELFEALGLNYLKRTIFHEECTMFVKTKLTDYAEFGNITKISEETFEQFSKLLEAGHKAPVYIKWSSDGVGYGVFAAEDLPAGTFISEYAGVVSPKHTIKNRTWSWKYPITGQFIEGFPTKVSLDGGIHGNEMRFMNHSDNRNTSPVFVHDGTTWLNCYYARKDIAKDQELLINYGKRYWKTRTKVNL